MTATLRHEAPVRSGVPAFLTASGVAVWGADIAQVALPLLAIVTLASTPAQVGWLTALGSAPFLVLALPVGAWLDRVRRRPVMIVSDYARFALLLSIPILHRADVLTFRYLAATVFLVGVFQVFFDLASQSHLPDLTTREHLPKVNARLATLAQTGSFAGPALAGWLCGVLDPPLVLGIVALGYLWSGLWLSTIRVREPVPVPTPGRSLRGQIAEGIRFVARERSVRAVMVAGAMVNVGIVGAVTMLPVIAMTELGWSQVQLGLLLSAGGVGGLLGALASRPMERRLGLGRSMIGIGLILAPASLVVPMVGLGVPTWVVAVAWAAVAFKVGFDGVLGTTLRQLLTPRALLGRVNGTMRLAFSGSVTLAGVLVAVLAGAIGARGALWVSCAGLALVWLPLVLSPVRHIVATSSAIPDH